MEQDGTAHRSVPHAPQPAAAMDGDALGRWGAFAAALSLAGLFMAAAAGDDYMFASGLLFVGFGLLLGARLMARWKP